MGKQDDGSVVGLPSCPPPLIRVDAMLEHPGLMKPMELSQLSCSLDVSLPCRRFRLTTQSYDIGQSRLALTPRALKLILRVSTICVKVVLLKPQKSSARRPLPELSSATLMPNEAA